MRSINNQNLACVSQRAFIDPQHAVTINIETVAYFDVVGFANRNMHTEFFVHFPRQRFEWGLPILNLAAW